LALHLLAGAALSGGRVASLTKTDLEDSISGYGQEFFTVPKAKKSVNAFLRARKPPDKWKTVTWLRPALLVLRYIAAYGKGSSGSGRRIWERDFKVRWRPLKIFMLAGLD